MSDEKPLVPKHLGVILDGNRRWAQNRGLPVIEGHRQGFLNVKKLLMALVDSGVEYVSIYVFSTENWQRSRAEVKELMKLFMWVATHEVNGLHEQGVRLRIVGKRDRLSRQLLKVVAKAEELTKDNTKGTLLICLDYGGQQEIADAVQQLVATGVKPEDVTPEQIAKHLYVPDVPAIDLVIRTSGEQRLSNFMLWRAAYSELLFTETLWPDLSEAELRSILEEYAKRQRRFGK